MPDYVRWLRSYVGSAPLILNAVAGIITNREGELLLQRRGGAEADNCWGLPGGIIELGESSESALARELLEETSLTVRTCHLLGVYSSPELVEYPNGDQCHMIAQVFVVDTFSGRPVPDGRETRELRYFSLWDRPTLFRQHLERAVRDFEQSTYRRAA